MFRKSRMFPVLVLVVMAITGSALANGNDVEFHGTVLGVTMQSSTEGVLTLRMMGFQIPVRLTGNTEIEAHGDAVGLDDIHIGDFVKVSGFFTNSTIVAQEVVIVDHGAGEFRLRGQITSVRPAAGGTVITLLGVDVLIDSSTKIERRGPWGGFTAENLEAGRLADARGRRVENQFVASRLKIGSREEDDIRVHFSGRITAISDGKLMIDTEGGSTAIVLVTTSTIVAGTPAMGKFVEIRGTLNSNLEVVASRIVVKQSRNSDDHPPMPGPVEFEKTIALSAVVPATEMRGESKIEMDSDDGLLRQSFEIHISHAQPGTEYHIQVEFGASGTVDFGTLRTDGDGSAEARFSTQLRGSLRDLNSFLPPGKTVRDFTAVRVLSGGVVLLQGAF